LQAALLRVKLRHLDKFNSKRRQLAEYYWDRLSAIPGLILPKIADRADPVWHLFVIRMADRDQLKSFLSENNIETLVHYPVPPHLSTAYQNIDAKRGDFPITESIAETALSLPLHPFLRLEELDFVSDVIRSFIFKS
jgi:dTDP-4-amino-4,6-dideoxygalactose transaminase